MGEIPEAAHTYAYLNTAYPCLNEKQLAIGETTFGGPDTLVNATGWFRIEELERVALQRCDNARDAIRLMGALAEQYGYGDSGECLTVADKNEVWQFEIVGIGKDRIGAAWVAKRVPDDHIAVSANIPRSPSTTASGTGRATSSSGSISTPTTPRARTSTTASTSSSITSRLPWASLTTWTNYPSPSSPRSRSISGR